MTDPAALTKRMDALAADLRLARLRKAEAEAECATAAQAEQDLTTAQTLAQRVAAACQETAHAQVARVVTRCLKAVFGENAYEFHVEFERKRGRTEARLTFRRGGRDVDPCAAAGGGTVDVASFALRLACLVLSRPRRRLFLCLDEPLKHLSRRYAPRARKLFELLAREMGVQILFVTHNKRLVCGKVVRLEDAPSGLSGS